MHRLAAVAGLALAAAFCLPALAGDLGLTFTGLSGQSGRLMVAVFNDQQAFTAVRDAVARAELTTTPGTTVAFGGLPPGRYAVAAFIDLNGNGKLDTNLFGVPTEPYGFSNGATGTLGPPGFDAAAVSLGEGTTTAQIPLQ